MVRGDSQANIQSRSYAKSNTACASGLSDACRNKGGLTMNSIRTSMLNLPELQNENALQGQLCLLLLSLTSFSGQFLKAQLV